MRKSEQLLNANIEKLAPKRTGSLAALGLVMPDGEEENFEEEQDRKTPAPEDELAASRVLPVRVEMTEAALSRSQAQELSSSRGEPHSTVDGVTRIARHSKRHVDGVESSAGETPDDLSPPVSKLDVADDHLGLGERDDEPDQLVDAQLHGVDDVVIDLTDGSDDLHQEIGAGAAEYPSEEVLDRFGKKFGSSPNTIRYGHYIPSTTFMKLEELKVDLAEITNRRITTENLFRLAQLRFPADSDGWLTLLNRHAEALGVDGGEVPTRHFLGNRVDKRWPSMMSRAKLQLLQAHGIDVDRRFLFSALLEELSMADRNTLQGQLVRS